MSDGNDVVGEELGEEEVEEQFPTVQSSEAEPEEADDATQPVPNDDSASPDDDDNKLDNYDECDNDVEAVPWHHMQLYHLYGDEADYFLHPEIRTAEKRATVASLKLLMTHCYGTATKSIGLAYNIFCHAARCFADGD